MSYGDDYDNPGYPGSPYPSTDLTDHAQHVGLGPRAGDTEINHRTANHPWGKVVQVAVGKPVTLVQTEAFPRPFPWAIQARFSLDGVTFTPTIPTGGGPVRFRFIKSFDVKTGPAMEEFILDDGDALPICALIARSLTVMFFNENDNVSQKIWVQFVVCPTTQIDCAELTPSGPATTTTRIAPMTSAVVVRIPTTTAPVNFVAEPRRGMFLITNQSASRNLYILIGELGVSPTPGDENASIILPPNTFSGYEIPMPYTGNIEIVWDGEDPDGFALVTQGLFPP